MHTYTFEARHDNPLHGLRMTTNAASLEAAVGLVMASERCPREALRLAETTDLLAVLTIKQNGRVCELWRGSQRINKATNRATIKRDAKRLFLQSRCLVYNVKDSGRKVRVDFDTWH